MPSVTTFQGLRRSAESARSVRYASSASNPATNVQQAIDDMFNSPSISGDLGINTNNAQASLNVQSAGNLYTNNENGPNGVELVSGYSTSDYTLYMGADATNGVGYIQSVHWGTAVAPLYLNARGGAVQIGGSGVGTPANLALYGNINWPANSYTITQSGSNLAFSGTLTATTVTPGTDNSTKVATTAFVQSAIAAVSSGVTTITAGTGLTGGGSGVVTLAVANNGITNALRAQMPANTIKGNNTAGTANEADLTAAQTMTLLGAAPLASPTFTGSMTVTGPASCTDFTIGNPNAKLWVADTTAVTTGVGGQVNLQGYNATPTMVSYAGVKGYGTSGTPGAESGDLQILVRSAGTLSQWGRCVSNGRLQFNSGQQLVPGASGVLTLPSTTDTLVGQSTVDTLSNKTLVSPTMTGTPVAPNASVGTNTTQIATTAYVQANSARPASTRTRTVLSSGSGTYTTPAGCKAINVRCIGGGGAGAGGDAGGGAGGNGGNTTFGSSLLSAGGGSGGGTFGNAPATGGTSSGGNINIQGSCGTAWGPGASSPVSQGPPGAAGPFGGSGNGGWPSGGIAGPGATNSGSGGGGGGGVISTGHGGNSGAAGGYCEALIVNPVASYAYAVGAGGTAGTAGGSGAAAGGAGGSGLIIIDEFY